MMDLLNTIITVVTGIALLGWIGLIVSFIPDIMLIFIISDLWQKNPRDKLTGWKLDIHLFLHSIWFMLIWMFVLVIAMFISTKVFWGIVPVAIIIIIHIIIDYTTHSANYGGHFRGYKKSNYIEPVEVPEAKIEEE